MDAVLPPRFFSLREAVALLAVLKQKFQRAGELRADLVELQAQLQRFGRSLEGPELAVDPKAPAEVRDLQRTAVRHIEELRQILREVAELGVEVKAADGLVDFRSRLHGRTVYLCWKYPEETITHWHELDTGFAGRKPLPAGGDFLGDFLH
jgi:hypothetical protein